MPIRPEQAQLAVGATSVFFAAVLVVVTAFYYWETRKHTAEMKRERRPVVKMNLIPWHGPHARLTIENIGSGTARSVQAEWGFTDSEIRETFKSIQIAPGDRHVMAELPFEEDVKTFSGIQKELQDREGVLQVTLMYEDGFGEEYREREQIPIRDVVEEVIGDEQLESSELEDITDELSDLTSAIESL